MALAVTGASAKTAKDSTNSNKPVFTVIKELPVTSMKDQNKSGTCWAYSTLSFFESEILKNSGKTYDLSEMFVANKTYMDRATKAVRMHGDVSFSQGGSAYDVLYCLKNYGIVPENAMPAPGTLIGDSLANFDEFFEVMTPYVEGIAKSKASKISSAWKMACRASWTHTSARYLSLSPMKEKPILHRASWKAWVSTWMIT